MIAESIIAAADELGPLRVPIVVRLQGTNAEQGQQMVSLMLLDFWRSDREVNADAFFRLQIAV